MILNGYHLKAIRFFKKIGLDYFIAGIIAMIFLAKIYPQAGLDSGRWSLPQLSNWGVTVIFFFYGLRLSKAKLISGLSNWKLHLTVQLSTFLLFPLILLAIRPLFSQHEDLWLGAFYLASLPSTVSSSVVMVSAAGGNIAAAIFNASISGLLGILLTPLWMSIVTSTEDGAGHLSDTMLKLFSQVLLPVLLGFFLQEKLGTFAERNKQSLKLFDQGIILTIVYTSFAESFAHNIFRDLQLEVIVFLGFSMLALFFLVFAIINRVCKLLGFNREDKITAVFCGSKKSLVHGTVMCKIIFNNVNTTGLILLPLMFYHALQLMIAAIISQKWSTKN